MLSKKNNTLMKNILTVLLLGIGSFVIAQTSSPYSRYGLGNFQQKGSVRSRMMGGTGVANQQKTDVNNINPSSLVAMDSMAVIFDIGFHANGSNFSSGDESQTVYSGNLDYVALMIPMHKRWFVSATVQPLTSVGYNINTVKTYNGLSPNEYYAVNFDGSGGVSLATVTNSFKLPWGFSVGAELGILWGNHNETITETYSKDISYTTRETVTYHTGSWVSTGMQFTHSFEKIKFVMGATYELPTTLTSYEESTIGSSWELIDESSSRTVKNNLPQGFGAGLSLTYNNRLTFSADIRQKQWEDSGFGVDPQRLCNNNIFSAGMEFTPNYNSNKYFERVSYRLGAHYESGSFEIANAPVKSGYVSAGMGLPGRVSSTLINVGFELGTIGGFSGKHITETYGQVNIGLNLGEIWFMKAKFY